MVTDYVKHIFQKSMCGQPAIRASTTGIWINVTVLATETHNPLVHNPLLTGGRAMLQFRGVKLDDCRGRLETRTHNRATRHYYYKPQFANAQATNLAGALAMAGKGSTADNKDATDSSVLQNIDYSSDADLQAAAKTIQVPTDGPLAALHIYKDVPIYLKVNVVQNALLRADILAGLVAEAMAKGRPISRINQDVLGMLG
ncbi:hypothetical protein BASA83_007117 [Batrachochytrium salamandrivorans]|nr:hypothetical protein BASA83_007117 [Batrachochytrium salamandrivorans]